MASSLDTDVEPDCYVDDSELDSEMLQQIPQLSFGPSVALSLHPRGSEDSFSAQNLGIIPRDSGCKSSGKWTSFEQEGIPDGLCIRTQNFNRKTQPSVQADDSDCIARVNEVSYISDEMIQDGAHVVFDWDNTLKLYDRETRQLSSRVSREFLMHLKRDRGCRLYIISAIRPSAINLSTILFEVDKLGLTDLFINESSDGVDLVDGSRFDEMVVEGAEYAHKGNIILSDYDKAETFLKLTSFDPARGDRVMFFDDESVNTDNFSTIVPNSTCYHIS